MRICDAQTSADDSTALAALITACIAQAALDHDEGVPFEDPPRRMIEENLWRAIRHGLDGKLIDLERAEEYPAAAAVDRLLAWTAPARGVLGIDPGLPDENGAQRQKRALAEGATMQDVYAAGGAMARTRPRRFPRERAPAADRGATARRLRQIKTEDVVLQTVATLVNLAGQKLSVEGAKDPAEARKAIDAAKQMLPLVPQDAVGPIQNALDQVQMLYAGEPGAPAPPRSRRSRRSGRPARDRSLPGAPASTSSSTT